MCGGVAGPCHPPPPPPLAMLCPHHHALTAERGRCRRGRGRAQHDAIGVVVRWRAAAALQRAAKGLSVNGWGGEGTRQGEGYTNTRTNHTHTRTRVSSVTRNLLGSRWICWVSNKKKVCRCLCANLLQRARGASSPVEAGRREACECARVCEGWVGDGTRATVSARWDAKRGSAARPHIFKPSLPSRPSPTARKKQQQQQRQQHKSHASRTVAERVPVRLLERRRHEQARALRAALGVGPAAEEALVRAHVHRARQRLGRRHVEQRQAVRVLPRGLLHGHVLGRQRDGAVAGVVAGVDVVMVMVVLCKGGGV